MKSKSCLKGAAVIGILAGLLRLAQYIFTIGKDGYDLPGTLSTVLNYSLVGLLVLGTVWILCCGFGGKKREVSFPALFDRSPAARLCFWALGLLGLADGLLRLLSAEARLEFVVAGLGLLGGVTWILIERFSLRGTRHGLFAALPALHLGAVLLDHFWATHKYIHISEYALVTLSLCAILLFTFAILKPAAGGASTGQRICATAGLTFIMACASLLPLLPAFYLQGMPKETFWTNGILFLTGLFYLVLSVTTLKRLSRLPAEQPKEEEPAAPDLSALNEYLSDLPDVEEE